MSVGVLCFVFQVYGGTRRKSGEESLVTVTANWEESQTNILSAQDIKQHNTHAVVSAMIN